LPCPFCWCPDKRLISGCFLAFCSTTPHHRFCLAMSSVPSYLRSTSSSDRKVKKDISEKVKKVVNEKSARTPARRVTSSSNTTKREEFRARPPPAPTSITMNGPAGDGSAVGISTESVETAAKVHKVVKGASTLNQLRRSASPAASTLHISQDTEKRYPSQTTPPKQVPGYMRPTVSRGYKEGVLQNSDDANKIQKTPSNAPVPAAMAKRIVCTICASMTS
jgi:hypothetical protein